MALVGANEIMGGFCVFGRVGEGCDSRVGSKREALFGVVHDGSLDVGEGGFEGL